MSQVPDEAKQRRGARRLQDVPPSVLAELAAGRTESVNLMEWLAADMPTLARAVASNCSSPSMRRALEAAAKRMIGVGITGRLAAAGSAIAAACDPFRRGHDFEELANHRCDLVRQWACYAVNDASLQPALREQLEATLRFADDPNMSVRETAWMAFRPHLAAQLHAGLSLLEEVARSTSPNARRFAVEVTRPRSVWGAHIPLLKRSPDLATPLLECVKRDTARYVRLAVGNWLNDASKTRPDWVDQICSRWSSDGNRATQAIVKRGRRTLVRAAASRDAVGAGFHGLM